VGLTPARTRLFGSLTLINPRASIFGALTTFAAITLLAFVLGALVAGLVELSAARVLGRSYMARFNYPAAVFGYVVVAGLVSWLGIAVPLILRGGIGAWAALKKSVQLSSGYEGALFLLVVETLVGSYLAWYGTFYFSRSLFPEFLRHTLWFGWFVYVIAVLASAAAEPPLFIGLSLLADPELLGTSSSPRSEHSPHIH
jgi:hypothetical protein